VPLGALSVAAAPSCRQTFALPIRRLSLVAVVMQSTAEKSRGGAASFSADSYVLAGLIDSERGMVLEHQT
jgi:hypothetical protein